MRVLLDCLGENFSVFENFFKVSDTHSFLEKGNRYFFSSFFTIIG